MRTIVSTTGILAALASALGISACGGVATDGGPSGGDGGRISSSRFPCVNPTPLLDDAGFPTGFEACADGTNRRPTPVACHYAPVPSGGSAAEAPGVVGPEGCVDDDDCGSTWTCMCSGSATVLGYCQAAACRSNADCAPGFDCRSYSSATATCSWVGGYEFACQRAEDECATPTDCDGVTDRCMPGADGIRRCSLSGGCPVEGRPFLVAGVVTTACVESRDDWATAQPVAPFAEALEPALRARVAARFTRAALLEHASVAAFARFILQLLAVGAPPELVQASQRALADEIEHARLCFGLAARYGGSPVGPGPLPVDGALGACDLETITRLTFREGCIGETLASVEAAEAAAHAADPVLAATLERIASDEATHAELAFRFVSWALERAPTLGAVLVEELDREEASRRCAPEGSLPLETTTTLAAHGVLPERHAARIEAATLREVVRPLTERLVARHSGCRAA